MAISHGKTDRYRGHVGWYRNFHKFLQATPAYHDFAAMFGGDSVSECNNMDILKLQHKAIGFLHHQLDREGRTRFTKAISEFAERFNAYIPELEPDEIDYLAKLNSNGWAQVADVDDETVDKILSYLKNAPLKPWSVDPDVEYSTAEKLRGKVNVGVVPDEFVFKCPEIMPLGFSDDILSIAGHHLQAPPILLGVTAWTSFAPLAGTKKTAVEAQKFHLDLDDYRFVKQFIYLTDVDENSGPHEYIPGTHDPEVILESRRQSVENNILTESEFDEWYFRKLRKEDFEVEKYLGIEPVMISGKSGSRLMVNTEGIHKGRVPVSKDRWILQFLYGVSPNVQIDVSKHSSDIYTIKTNLEPELIRYSGQLFDIT